MPGETRACAACHETFVVTQGGAKGRTQRYCSIPCAGEGRRGKQQGGARHRHVRSGAVGDHEACTCSTCTAGRATDRSALIAKVAAEKGVTVSPEAGKPRKKLTPYQMAQRAARFRAWRLTQVTG